MIGLPDKEGAVNVHRGGLAREAERIAALT
jgi:hypothetical protein